LKRYGEAIYGTRGGPFKNGPWGGSSHKGNKLYLFIYEWPHQGPLKFDPMPRRVLSARTLEGGPVTVIHQDSHELQVEVPAVHRIEPVTVIELTINAAIEPGTLFGIARMITTSMTEYGHNLSENASMGLSSMSHHDRPEDHLSLFKGERSARGYAFHTEPDENPWVLINLHEVRNVKAVVIENRPGERRTEGLILSVSLDGHAWEQVWQAEVWEEKWLAVVTHFHAGIEVPGRPGAIPAAGNPRRTAAPAAVAARDRVGRAVAT
jgi:hypothetical protein